MKKQLLITLLPLLALTACNKNSTYKLDLSVASPAGAPATAFYKYLTSDNLEVDSNANNILSYFAGTNKDVIVAPTNYGIKVIKDGTADYKIAANITFGNFYLLATGKDSDSTLNEGDKIIAFQQNGVGGKLFNYVYGDLNLETTYLEDGSAIVKQIIAGKGELDADYVLLAQPAVNNVLSKFSSFSVYANVQNDYKAKSGGKEITQASIFVRNGLNKNVIENFLSNIENDVKELLEDPKTAIDKYDGKVEDEIFSGKLSSTKEDLVKLLTDNNQIGLGYKDAYSNKESIDAFIGTLGMGATSEEIYFRID